MRSPCARRWRRTRARSTTASTRSSGCRTARWRWSIHLAFGLSTALMMLGRDGQALAEANRGLAEAEQTESLKYVGWFHARRGELALRGGDAAAATESLKRAVAIARRIAYPT